MYGRQPVHATVVVSRYEFDSLVAISPLVFVSKVDWVRLLESARRNVHDGDIIDCVGGSNRRCLTCSMRHESWHLDWVFSDNDLCK